MSNTLVQSGKLSAVGRCIESVFGAVPHTSTAIGGNNNPHRFSIIKSGGGIVAKADIEIDDEEIDGLFEPNRSILQGKSYPGKFDTLYDPETMQYDLTCLFGRDKQTLVETGAFTHEHWAAKYAPSLAYEEQFGDATNGALFSATLVERTEITYDGVVRCSTTVAAYHGVPNEYRSAAGVKTKYDLTSAAAMVLPVPMGGDDTATVVMTASPSYVDVQVANDGPMQFGEMTFGSIGAHAANIILVDFGAGFVPLDGELVKGQFSLTIERVIQGFMTGGGGFDMSRTTSNIVRCSGKLGILYHSNQVPYAVLKRAKLSINFKILGPNIPGTATPTPYSHEVYLPNLTLLEGGVDIPSQAMMTGGQFRAQRDRSLGYAVKITDVNSFDNSRVHGRYISAASTTTVGSANLIGVSSLVVTATAGFKPGASIVIDAGGTPETVKVDHVVDGTHLALVTPLVADHAAGQTVAQAAQNPGGLGGWLDA